MKFTEDQFEAIAYIFERKNSYPGFHSSYEKEIISDFELKDLPPNKLEQILVDGIEQKIYSNEKERIDSYWALSKSGNKNLINYFRKWLNEEVSAKNYKAIFQILIALDKLEESVFEKNRTSRSYDETNLNLKDAKNYLENFERRT